MQVDTYQEYVRMDLSEAGQNKSTDHWMQASLGLALESLASMKGEERISCCDYIKSLTKMIRDKDHVIVTEGSPFLSDIIATETPRFNFAKRNNPSPLTIGEKEKMIDDVRLHDEAISKKILPRHYWKQIEENWKKMLSDYFQKNCLVEIMHINDIEEDFNVDIYIQQKCLDGIGIHDDYSMLMTTLSAKNCASSFIKVANGMKLAPNVTKVVISGIKSISSGDKKQIDEEEAYHANFGASSSAQANHTSQGARDSYIAMGGLPCQMVLNNTDTTPLTNINAWRYDYFSSVFDDPGLEPKDRWYAERTNKKRKRTRRQTDTMFKEDRIHMPFTLSTSIPKITQQINRSCAASFENDVRSVEEVLLKKIFGALPYTLLGEALAESMSTYAAYFDVKNVDRDKNWEIKLTQEKMESLGDIPLGYAGIPFKHCCRPLNKGATGVVSEKPLHDDGNAVLCPGMWSSLKTEKRPVVLIFRIPRKQIIMEATLYRFALFYGWIAHKTEFKDKDNENVDSTIDLEDNVRVHHSGFVKHHCEHFGLSAIRDMNNVIKGTVKKPTVTSVVASNKRKKNAVSQQK